ncbi:uncharacterized protein LOC131251420 isoform X2 [Magnolia sinica]|uniref:uncharacterized protein LOC131251420 isoform X2 n=1 Tax=Magnolia sinica TaxID=86752 RepID=UPI002659F70E|nr:uncharacterized protein LOC131251420 isoform X2 [Magnolia sinica]
MVNGTFYCGSPLDQRPSTFCCCKFLISLFLYCVGAIRMLSGGSWKIYWKDFLNCQGIGNVLTAKARASNGHMSVTDTSQNETLDAGPGNLKMSFSSTSGQLKRMTNYRTGVKDLDVELESTKQKSKQNLQQAILIERERVT